MNRLVGAPLAAVGALALLAGCSAGGGGSTQEDGVTTLTFSMWAGSAPETEALETLVGLVEEEYPEIELQLETAPFNDYWTRLAAQASGGTEACILGVQSPRAASIEQLLLPLDDGLLADAGIDLAEFEDAIVEGTQVDGTQLAVPYDLGPWIMYYNAEMFADAGVDEPTADWTVADFEEAAAALTGDGKYGYATNPSLDTATVWALTLGGSQGVAADGTLQMDDPAMVESVEFQQGLVADGSSPQLPATSDTYNALNTFIAGDAAMVVDGPWQIAYVAEQVPFEYGVAVIPAGPNGTSTAVAGSGYGVSASCEYPEEALKAISVLTGPEAQTALAEQGRAFPSRTAEQPAYFQGAFEIAEETLTAASASGEPLRSTVNWTQVNTLFAQYSVSAMNGDMTADEFLGTIQSQTEAGAGQ
ncbi:sugar ABC transporter substrate-binding protein [Agromyces rhizosphaerae]|uniref:Sugar ABC transporter substrate-binding protein n=1 Tax=Agromyces rhizosphaerae TaxID=88374 RepID=A0A9W6CYX3_9MICO|nr:sugar ABC transporter substrate-binding protein [Agromyces rhizosphaerae]GLI27772.1 sugar ABC transporter substrate-binding protein [Agromyces rhizosphaerae]